jgi:hypothetical protein
MSEVQAPVTTEREVTIYATRGGNMKKIMTSAQTWGELQPLVRREGFDLSSLLAAENITKTDLVNDLAVLPSGSFRLFLRPKQTKSGAPDRKECFAIIKAHIAANPGDKAKFTIDGKNMTQLSTSVVQALVLEYCGGPNGSAVAVSPVKEKAAKAAKVEAVKESKPGSNVATEARGLTDSEKVENALALVESLSEYYSYAKVEKHLKRLLYEISPEMREETEEEALAREARALGY